MGLLDGKVAFITGAGRGQGRSHAVRLAQEGADIVAVDICAQIPSIEIPLSSRDDLEETRQLVEEAGGRIVCGVGDVRDRERLAQIARDAMDAFGRIDIVLPNAGVWGANTLTQGGIDAPMEPGGREQIFRDTIDVNLFGVWNTMQVTIPHLIAGGRGGTIVLTSSTAGAHGVPMNDFAQDAYAAAKHGIVGLMQNAAIELASHWIRVNVVMPTGVRTPMFDNPVVARYFEAKPELGGLFGNALNVPMIDPVDVSNAIVYLASDLGRYITGVSLPVDAGFLVAGGLGPKYV